MTKKKLPEKVTPGISFADEFGQASPRLKKAEAKRFMAALEKRRLQAGLTPQTHELFKRALAEGVYYCDVGNDFASVHERQFVAMILQQLRLNDDGTVTFDGNKPVGMGAVPGSVDWYAQLRLAGRKA